MMFEIFIYVFMFSILRVMLKDIKRKDFRSWTLMSRGGLFDSGGGSSAQPVSQPSNSTSTSKVEYQPYVEKQLEPLTQRALTESQINRVVGPTDTTKSAWAQLQATQGMGNEQLNNASDYYKQAGQDLSGLDYSKYMNPYTSNVLNNQADLMNRQYTQQNQAAQGQATMAGAYGGSRADMQQSLNRDLQNRTIGDMYSQGLSNAYTNAQQMAQADIANKNTSAANQIKLADTMRNYSQADIQALANLGAQQQQEAQNMSDSERANISFLESALKGVATPSTTSTNSYTPMYTYVNQNAQNMGGLTSLMNLL